ncbi:MAG: anion permease [Wenzhouxiangella sp.]|nr:anion permease [Wenzhouxiangella sp.]MCH8478793.1 anion permease [Wenzhouxiangella sp.]
MRTIAVLERRSGNQLHVLAIDWPIVVLLGALIPVGQALENTGATLLIASGVVDLTGAMPAWAILALVMIITMTLSDIIDNAATVGVMAPIGISIANVLGASPDPFLMVIAVSASCAFLTPNGHQANPLVMGRAVTGSVTTGAWVCRWRF